MAADSPGRKSTFHEGDAMAMVTSGSYSSDIQHSTKATDGGHVSNRDGSAQCQLYKNGQFTMIDAYCIVFTVTLY